MSKAKSTDNILVDMYDLKLSENPEIDKPIIIEFFNKYSPTTTQYLTAKDTEGVKDMNEFSGSLGGFEKISGKKWFQTDQVKVFYDLWHLVKEIIDGVIKRKLTRWQLIRVKMLLDNVKPSLVIGNKDTRILMSIGWIPQEIDPNEYEFFQSVSFDLNTISGNQGSITNVLYISELKYDIFKAFLQLLHGEVVIRKCLAEDCQRAFIPKRQKQLFHGETCRSRIAKRRERNQKVISHNVTFT